MPTVLVTAPTVTQNSPFLPHAVNTDKGMQAQDALTNAQTCIFVFSNLFSPLLCFVIAIRAFSRLNIFSYLLVLSSYIYVAFCQRS